MSYFFNGQNIGEISGIFDMGTIVGIPTIGNQGIFNNNNITNAKFMDVRLYDKAITGGNISSIYNNGLGTFETVLYSNLLYQYRFYETDYSVIGNINYVNNWGMVQNTKGRIINNLEQIILPTKLFYFNSSILPTVVGNQGMTVCFWAKLLNNSGSNYLFNFNGNINNFPINFSVKTLFNNANVQIYIEINNSQTSYINISYNELYFITVSLYKNELTQKIDFNFFINWRTYMNTIPTQINDGVINGLASLGYFVQDNVLNSAYAEYADTRLYNTVLSSEEIYFLYNKRIGTFNNITRAIPLYEYRFFTNDYSIQTGSFNKNVRNWGSLQDTSGFLSDTASNLLNSYNLLISYNVNTLNRKAFSLNNNFDVSFVNTGITVCFWVYPIAMDVSCSDWYFYFNGAIGGTNAIGFSVKTTNNSESDPQFYLESNNVILNFPATIYNTWNHITVTGYENNNSPLKIYLNGQNVGNLQSQYTTGYISGVFHLGNSFSTNVLKSYNANAKYTDVRLYNTVLQGVEIQQIYNSGAGTDNLIRNNSILYQYLFNPNDYYNRNNITFISNKATSSIVGTSGIIIPEPPVFEPLFSTGKALFSCVWVNRSYTGPLFRLIDFSANYLINNNANNNGNNLIGINNNDILGKLQDFYVDARNSVITTSPNGMGVALNDWLSFGGTKIYVDIWYDQTGNNNNATTNNISLYTVHTYYDVDVNNELKYIPYLDTSRKMINFIGTKFFTLPNETVPYGNSSYTVSTRLNSINGRGDFLSSGDFRTRLFNNFSTNTYKGDASYEVNKYCNYWDFKYFFLSNPARQSDPINQSVTFIHDGSNAVSNPNDINNYYYKTNSYVDEIYDSESNVYNINPPTLINNIIQPLFTDISGVRIERSTTNINDRFNFMGANRINVNNPDKTFRLSYYSGIINYMWISNTVLDDIERGIIENIGNF